MPALCLALVVLLAALIAPVALADPPGRVGRITVVAGDASVQGPEGEPIRAEVNWPISSGFVLQTASNARVEVRVGSIALRADGDTTLRFARVDDAAVAVVVDRGTLGLRLRARDTVPEMSVQTPEGLVTFADVGRYRVDVGRVPGTVVVAADRGFARVAGADVVIDVRSGRAVELASGATRFVTVLADAFDDWTLARDRRDDAVAQGFVSPEMTGHEDLSAYGDWRTTASYGAVWVPRAVPVGWAPYRFGRWQWIAPWGWTWIDDSPWGFAPFHYGRWAFIDGFWGWAPGTWVARPVWAPALVGWIGRPGWSVTFAAGGFAAAGWFPLAPREPFFPWYRASPVYVQNINITHVTNINVHRPPPGGWNSGTGSGVVPGNAMGGMGGAGVGAAGVGAGTGAGNAVGGMGLGAYANARLPNAVTLAPAAALEQGQRIAGSPINVPVQQLAGAQPVAPIAPAFPSATRASAGGLGGMGAGAMGSVTGGMGGGAIGGANPGTTGGAGGGAPVVPLDARAGRGTANGPWGAAGAPGVPVAPGGAPAGLASGTAPDFGARGSAGGLGASAQRTIGGPGSAVTGAVGGMGGAGAVPITGVPSQPAVTPPASAVVPRPTYGSSATAAGAGGIGGSVGTPMPSYRPPAPSYGSSAPSYGSPGSGGMGGTGGSGSAPAPNYRPPSPSYGSAAPSYGSPGAGGMGGSGSAPAPSYRPPPSYGTGVPSYGSPGSGGMGGMGGSVGAPAPTYRPPAASYGSAGPSYAPPAPRTYSPPVYSPPAYSAPARPAPPIYSAPPAGGYGVGGMGGGMRPPSGGFAAPSFSHGAPPAHAAPPGGGRGSAGGLGGMGGR